MPVFSKDPAATLDYSQDWSQWLNSGDAIASSSWSSPGLTQVTDAFTTSSTTVWLSGGILGQTCRVVNQVVTTGGLTAERTMHIVVENQ